MARRVAKARLNLRIDGELKEWAKQYAHTRGIDVTKLIREYLLELRARVEQENHAEFVEQI